VANLPLRYAVEDIEIDGITIHQGEAILACYAAAGRDRTRHSDDADEAAARRSSSSRIAALSGRAGCASAAWLIAVTPASKTRRSASCLVSRTAGSRR
jgi:cytochrome P450